MSKSKENFLQPLEISRFPKLHCQPQVELTKSACRWAESLGTEEVVVAWRWELKHSWEHIGESPCSQDPSLQQLLQFVALRVLFVWGVASNRWIWLSAASGLPLCLVASSWSISKPVLIIQNSIYFIISHYISRISHLLVICPIFVPITSVLFFGDSKLTSLAWNPTTCPRQWQRKSLGDLWSAIAPFNIFEYIYVIIYTQYRMLDAWFSCQSWMVHDGFMTLCRLLRCAGARTGLRGGAG